MTRLADLFQRRWACWVYDSGLHNGCRCTPDDPHDDCHWEFRASLRDTPKTREFLNELSAARLTRPEETQQ